MHGVDQAFFGELYHRVRQLEEGIGDDSGHTIDSDLLCGYHLQPVALCVAEPEPDVPLVGAVPRLESQSSGERRPVRIGIVSMHYVGGRGGEVVHGGGAEVRGGKGDVGGEGLAVHRARRGYRVGDSVSRQGHGSVLNPIPRHGEDAFGGSRPECLVCLARRQGPGYTDAPYVGRGVKLLAPDYGRIVRGGGDGGLHAFLEVGEPRKAEGVAEPPLGGHGGAYKICVPVIVDTVDRDAQRCLVRDREVPGGQFAHRNAVEEEFNHHRVVPERVVDRRAGGGDAVRRHRPSEDLVRDDVAYGVRDLLRHSVARERRRGAVYAGPWHIVGTVRTCHTQIPYIPHPLSPHYLVVSPGSFHGVRGGGDGRRDAVRGGELDDLLIGLVLGVGVLLD